jgi:hypothetical protein
MSSGRDVTLFGNKTTDLKRDMLPANSDYSFILNMAEARSFECRYISTNIHGAIAQKPVIMYFATRVAVLQMKSVRQQEL